MDINREDLSWAAGLFEGEGCFTYLPAGISRPIRASLGMTDEDVVRKFHKIIQLGTVDGPITPSPDKRFNNRIYKPKWVWRVDSFERVQAVGAMFWPWLGIRRKNKFREILDRYKKDEPKSNILRRDRIREIKEALRSFGTQGTRWTSSDTQAAIASRFNVSPSFITYIKHEMVKEEGALRLSKIL
jgi:hypothetical protein